MNKKLSLFIITCLSSLSFFIPNTHVNAETATIQERASTSISEYYVENVTDEGFDFVITLNSNTDIYGIGLSYWKNGNYGGMKIHSKVQKLGYNKFKAHIKMKDIGSGTEYVYFGIQPVSDNAEPYLGDVTIKLDKTNPNLNLSLSNTNWTNKNITLNTTAKDDMNIIEQINFTDKDGKSNIEPLYSNPKVLLVKGYASSVVEDKMKNELNNLTIVSAGSITSISQLKGYDVVIYDGRYWEINERVATILNEAFEQGVSLITNFNDDYKNLSIGNGSITTVKNSGYVFKDNAWDDGNLNGRVNRFAYLMDGKRESDEQYAKIGAGSNVFVISTAVNDVGKSTSGILMKTHSDGNKWIHFQSSDLAVSSGAMRRGIDEIMSGTMKTRQTYNKAYEISSNGTYSVEVDDFSANGTRKSIVVSNIDKTNPTLNITGNPTKWSKNAYININAKDDLSGIKQIILPNGNSVNGSSASMVINQNGKYEFQAIDNAGNITKETIDVKFIDNTIQDIKNVKVDMEMINAKNSFREINVSYDHIVDSQSGLKGYSHVIDNNPNTIPDDIVDSDTNKFSVYKDEVDVLYYHIKAIDNAGNTSNVVHGKIDVPVLTGEVKVDKNMIKLDWTMDDIKNKTFKVYQKKPGSEEFQTVSTTDLSKSKQVKVLNIYPVAGEEISYKTWDGEGITSPKSASLKKWMEEPSSENPKGYGKGLIEVDPISINAINNYPNSYFKNKDGSWKYDVIMIGSWDSNNNQDLNTVALEIIKAFINDGRGVLLGHDSISYLETLPNLRSLATLLNIEPTGGRYYNGYNEVSGVPPTGVDSTVNISKQGLLTNFPWTIGELGTELKVPGTHTLGQLAKGDNWLKFKSENGQNDNANYYLTSWNNTAMIQTGHSNGNATSDEQKILANTLFYLNQLSTNNYLEDYSGQDVSAPNAPSVKNYNIDDNGFINVNLNSTIDNGSEYEYYVESKTKDNSITTLSNGILKTITSGLKGYSYVIDTNPNTIPDNNIDISPTENIKSKLNGEKDIYVHIKAIDNAGNVSETLHYRVNDSKPPVLTFELSPSSWTNGSVKIIAKATDEVSGVKNITLPNGTIVAGNTATFTVSINGVYTFKTQDYIGNEGVYSITITNIDKNKPTVSISNNANWTNKDVQVIIESTDN